MEQGNHLWKPGWFKVYAGAMYTGKTNDFLNEFSKIQYNRRIPFQAFKPTIDDRFPPKEIRSRNGGVIPCTPVDPKAPESIVELLDRQTLVLGIDELQFFDPRIVHVVQYLRDRGLYVVGTMLDRDFRDEPFGPSAELLVQADEVHKTVGVCMALNNSCQNPGVCTQRLVDGKPALPTGDTVVIDKMGKSSVTYELRCREHHVVPGKTPAYKIQF